MKGRPPPVPRDSVVLTGSDLSLEDLGRVAYDRELEVRLSDEAEDAVNRSRDYVESLLGEGGQIYGVTTGFGRLAEVVIPADKRETLQANLIRSHSAGVGELLSMEEVRAIMVLRANALSRGHSGCRLVVVKRLLECLNAGLHPAVPGYGSVGASGDLAPLAHIALAILGEGTVEYQGSLRPTGDVLKELGLQPLILREKEGLALINGTQATTGIGTLAFLRAVMALESAELAGAMTLEGLKGTPEAFRPEAQAVRPHEGQATSAARLTAHLGDSEIRESHRHGDPRVQDAYCVRCMPQVHGAAREVFRYVRRILQTEANSTTDNPLVLPDVGAVISAGNFHAQIVAQALDFLAIALADLAAISERRIERLLNPDLSGHAPFLTRNPGIESGFMIAQVTAADLLAEMRVLAHPASVDSVPTSANQEDHVSMGLAAARKVRRSVECLEYVLAIELLCAAQAVDDLAPLR
ncbi:MAG: histidine ammonia-lyase, partial [Gemmatimonadetes bacterium]|nr:histidine ammonia-lyase [Gemmatimonadota bacterium]